MEEGLNAEDVCMIDQIICFFKDYHDYSVQFFGGFFGAFAAFLFLLLADRLRRRRERKRNIRNEHAALERYFGDVYSLIIQNKRMVRI